MSQRMFGAWGKDMQRGCLIQIIAAGIVVPVFLIFIILPLYFANRPGVSDRESLVIMVAGGVLFLLAVFGGVGGYVLITLRRRASWLDEAFLTFGLEGKGYNITGRQFHGRFRGREMDVLFQRGPNLMIYLSTTLMTRLTINDPQSVVQRLAGVFNQEPIEFPQDQLLVYAQDHAWAKSFLAEPAVRDLCKDLIFDEHPFLIRSIEFQPGTILLRLYRSKQLMDFQFSAEQTHRWVQALVEIAELAETQPSPQEELAPSTLSASVREGKASKYGIVVALAMVGVALCVGLISVIIVLLLSTQS